jgi:FkbM family methyltransferase
MPRKRMKKTAFLEGFLQSESLARGGRIKRFLHQPLGYLRAIFYKYIQFPRHRQSKKRITRTFFQQPFTVLLPAGTDIFLTGCKANEPERRLTLFLIQELRPGAVFIDAGSHFGFYASLAAKMVGESGRVLAIEPSPDSFAIVQENLADYPQAMACHCALDEEEEELTFYRFPGLYSEYNTLHPEQFAGQSWYHENPPEAIPVRATTLDALVRHYFIHPTHLKIDVEGNEFRLLKGAANVLLKERPTVVMEFLHPRRGNTAHVHAWEYICGLGYSPHCILHTGKLQACTAPEDFLTEKGADSDNFVFLP